MNVPSNSSKFLVRNVANSDTSMFSWMFFRLENLMLWENYDVVNWRKRRLKMSTVKFKFDAVSMIRRKKVPAKISFEA